MQTCRTFLRLLALYTALLAAVSGAGAAAQSPSLEQGIAAELQSLASHAGTIFVGQITSIDRKGGVVEVTFRVDQPVHGATQRNFVLREWAGLWPQGHVRYAVGQRVLAFLHTNGAAGLSSPVHGLEGLVPVVVQGRDASPLIDVRRLAAAVIRTPNTALPTEAQAGMLLSDALALTSPQSSATVTNSGQVPLPMRGKQPRTLPLRGQPQGPVEEPVLGTHSGPLRMPLGTEELK